MNNIEWIIIGTLLLALIVFVVVRISSRLKNATNRKTKNNYSYVKNKKLEPDGITVKNVVWGYFNPCKK